MKNIIVFFNAFLCIALLSTGCSTDDSVSSPTTNATITIQNVGDGNGNLTKNYQFTSLTLTPTDNSSSATTYTFVASVGKTTSVEVKLPKTGSYKIIVYADNTAKYIWWNSIAMVPESTTAIYLICLNSTYIGQSTGAGINPSGSTL